MNIRDCKQVHYNLVKALAVRRDSDAAYAWTRLLCRQLRSLTVKRIGEAYDWV